MFTGVRTLTYFFGRPSSIHNRGIGGIREEHSKAPRPHSIKRGSWDSLGGKRLFQRKPNMARKAPEWKLDFEKGSGHLLSLMSILLMGKMRPRAAK